MRAAGFSRRLEFLAGADRTRCRGSEVGSEGVSPRPGHAAGSSRKPTTVATAPPIASQKTRKPARATTSRPERVGGALRSDLTVNVCQPFYPFNAPAASAAAGVARSVHLPLRQLDQLVVELAGS